MRAFPTAAGGTASAVFAVILSLALMAPVEAVTRSFGDAPGGPTGPHNINRVLVDNTGRQLAVTVWHQGSRWSGGVVLRLDTTTRPGAEHVVTVRHSHRPAPTFYNADGSRWRCPNRLAVSPPDRRFTRLTFPRRCALGRAPHLAVRAAADPRQGHTDVLRTATVPRSAATQTPAPTTPSGAVCQSPVWTTSRDEFRGWDDPERVGGFPNGVGAYGQYLVQNSMWNAAGYNATQRLSACDFDSWHVTTTATNANGDGAVKTYPNVHVDYIDWGTGRMQPLSDFASLKMRFTHRAPTMPGIWNVAFDVWLNGVGNGTANELMIWTENHNQRPAGTQVATVTIGGIEWAFWKGYNGHYLAFVPTNGRVITSGELDLIPFTNWLAANRHIPANSVLGQVDYGVEVVSTNGNPTRFHFTDFKITETPR